MPQCCLKDCSAIYTPVLLHSKRSLGVQAGGRLLTYHDITPDLQGRRAELYWPDDNLWYLISIEHVDLLTQKASIMYSTGETEELNLNDIVKEGHMSLIPDR